MAQQLKLLARYADFSKGDAGWVDKANVPAGSFTGEQVCLYRDGSVGPRSGVLDLAPTGLPAGTIQGIGYVDQAVTGGVDWVWIHKGTTLGVVPVYDTNGHVLTGQAFAASAGAFAHNPTSNVVDTVDYSPTTTIFTLFGDQAYKADWSTGAAGTLSALTGSPGAGCCEVIAGYLVLASSPTNTNRLFFSKFGDFTTWPALNFIDISGGLTGAGSPIISAIRALRDVLLVWTHIGQLFIVSNIQPDPTSGVVTAQIRQFMPGDVMSGPEKKAIGRAREGAAWWTRRDSLPFPGDQAYDAPSAVPVSFDGATRVEFPPQGGYLRQPDFTNDRLSRTTAVPGREEKSILLLDHGGRALIGKDPNKSGTLTWTRHNLAASGVSGHLVTVGLRGDLFMLDAAGADLSAWQFELDRPPWKFSGSAVETLPYTPLDHGAAFAPAPWIATAEFRNLAAEIQSIDQVVVFFTAFATRDTAHNHFDVAVQQFDAVDADEHIEIGSFFPPDSDTSGGAMVANGVTIGLGSYDAAPDTIDHRRRATFLVPQDHKPSLGSRVLIQNLVGVSIHAIQMYGTTYTDARP